ncbi:MAG: D-alanine aminotransferase [Nitrospirae bacterium]|nr:MAG: putative aminodeoxychorismate lyase [Nitrospira sp. OLB3]MBV6471403.1 D-alanine aminotransferase [Nitrospirota bacterium]MCE7965575.1 branched-chain amino acid aminotransferase [Nitrospira sp. NTP2]MCK6492212.1 aminotransferase class IV [Nitrospira sp.]MEB2339053.1 aminotransferase class IV [Nitrospirales bacterium]
MWVFLNDRFVRKEEALVSVFDHGFLYGDGVYETIRSYGSRIFMRDQHLARLRRSAEAIGLTIPIPEGDWPTLLHEAMRRNDVGNDRHDAYLRITISRGEGEIGLDPSLCPKPTVVIMTKPLQPLPARLFEEGVALTVARTRRNLPEALSPQIKATNFLNNILAKRESIAAGTFDSLLLNWRDELTECTISNLFFLSEGALRTPALDCGILDGITRGIVIQLAQEEGLAVQEGHYRLQDLQQAAECFLTNTSMEIMPVGHLDSLTIGGGKPGPVTRLLQARFVAGRTRFLEPSA